MPLPAMDALPPAHGAPMLTPEKMLDADALCTIRNWVGQVNRKIKSTVAYRDIKCTIILEPCQTVIPFVHIETECQRDCLQVMREAGRRMKRNEIFAALEDAKLIHGESTIRNALADLVRRGKLIGPPKGTRHGYALPEQG